MAGDFVRLDVKGLDELNRALRSIPEKLRKRALRNALAAAGRVVRDEARSNAPLIERTSRSVRRGVRAVGTLRRNIVVRTSKRDRRSGDVGVFVNVRPAKGGKAGAKSPTDAFYWRWIEFGWNPARKSDGAGKRGKRYRRGLNRPSRIRAIDGGGTGKRQPGRGFLQSGVAKLGEALQVFTRLLIPKIEQLNKKGGGDL